MSRVRTPSPAPKPRPRSRVDGLRLRGTVQSMSQPNEAPQPAGPAPGRVRSGRASARVAAFIVIGSLIGVVLIALFGELIDRLSGPWISPEPSPQAVAAVVVTEPGDAPQDFAGFLPGDDGVGPVALGTINGLPNPDRLDFLFEFCTPACNRDAHWMDPTQPRVGSGLWTAGRPFHVREGFINNGPELLGDGFDVVLYVTRLGEGSEEVYPSDVPPDIRLCPEGRQRPMRSYLQDATGPRGLRVVRPRLSCGSSRGPFCDHRGVASALPGVDRPRPDRYLQGS